MEGTVGFSVSEVSVPSQSRAPSRVVTPHGQRDPEHGPRRGGPAAALCLCFFLPHRSSQRFLETVPAKRTRHRRALRTRSLSFLGREPLQGEQLLRSGACPMPSSSRSAPRDAAGPSPRGGRPTGTPEKNTAPLKRVLESFPEGRNRLRRNTRGPGLSLSVAFRAVGARTHHGVEMLSLSKAPADLVFGPTRSPFKMPSPDDDGSGSVYLQRVNLGA